jgi:hypothetical protein
MSYYDNPQSQWSSSTQNNWEHQGSTTPVRAGASGPQPQDDYAFSYQFDGMSNRPAEWFAGIDRYFNFFACIDVICILNPRQDFNSTESVYKS